jgi:hypothetical protein
MSIPRFGPSTYLLFLILYILSCLLVTVSVVQMLFPALPLALDNGSVLGLAEPDGQTDWLLKVLG